MGVGGKAVVDHRIGETPAPEVAPLDTPVEFTFYGHDVRQPHHHY